MTGALFATATLALLIVPPAMILLMPAKHLAYLVPAGAAAYMLLWHYVVETEDLGPAGIIIVAYLALLFIVNIGALSTRAIVEAIWAVRARYSARNSD